MKVNIRCGQCGRHGDYAVYAGDTSITCKFCLFEGYRRARELEITDEVKWQAFEDLQTAFEDLQAATEDLERKYEELLERLNQQGRNV